MSPVTAPVPDAHASGPPHLSRPMWFAAAAVVLLAVALRLAYLWIVAWNGHGLRVIDPDQYGPAGLLLAQRHFTVNALFRSVAFYQYAKPPLYNIVLALVSCLPGDFARNAAVLQALLGGALVAAMFWIGFRIHSAKAGLVAAILSSVYWPFATGANVFFQEGLYIPLLMIAFAVLVDAVARQASPRVWAVAGAVFGLAALTRSMPVYYLAPALAIHAWRADDRRRAVREAGACLLAFVVTIAPYSIAISRHVHQLVLIENMGGIVFPMRYPESRAAVHHTAPPPTVLETASMLTRAFVAHPAAFAGDRLSDAALLVRLRGGRTVQLLDNVGTAAEARVYKWMILTFDDGLFALVCILAPFGWALARHRRESRLVGLWILLNVALLASFSFTGARYRVPCVPALMIFASVAITGEWTRPSRRAIAAAALATTAVVLALAPSIPAQRLGDAEYGLHHQQDDGVTRRVGGAGAIGVNVMAFGGVVKATVSTADAAPAAPGPVTIDVRLGGVPLESWTLPTGVVRQVHYVWPHPGPARLELRASDASGHAAPIVVEVPMTAPSHDR